MWGTRNDKIHKGELLNFPIRFPAANSELELRIIALVKKLRSLPFDSPKNLFADDVNVTASAEIMRELEKDLDQCIFDLYEMRQADRDLVRDLCKFGLPFFYDGWKSKVTDPYRLPAGLTTSGYVENINRSALRQLPLLDYVKVFASQWEAPLRKHDGELAYSIIQPPDENAMLAVIFLSHSHERAVCTQVELNDAAWKKVLRDIGDASVHPMASNEMYVDGLIRIISHSYILIMKRNEQRLWTRSLARVDAEATWLRALK